MTIDRRKLFALSGLGAIGAGTGALGPEVQLGSGGIVIRIYQDYSGRWVVAVPDFDADPNWLPGHVMPVKGMPIDEFLAAIARPNTT